MREFYAGLQGAIKGAKDMVDGGAITVNRPVRDDGTVLGEDGGWI